MIAHHKELNWKPDPSCRLSWFRVVHFY